MGPGENAGAVDIGEGLVCAFKVESHNHPSAVEPFQGAATGVGGILRDIFAIGARPIAVLDSLRFGELDPALTCPEGGVEGRRGGRARATCWTGPSPASATTATRSACPQSAARSTSRLPTSRTASSTRWRSGSPERERLVTSAAVGVGNTVVLFGAVHRPRRHRRRLGAGLRGVGRGRRQATDGAGGGPVRGEEADGVLAGAARARVARLPAGPRRGRPDLLGLGDGLQGRGRDRHRRGQGSPARGRHGAVRDHGQRVPGAHAVRGRARQRRRGAGAVREVGGRRSGDRHGHRHGPDARARRRRAGRGDAGAGARR